MKKLLRLGALLAAISAIGRVVLGRRHDEKEV